MISKVQDQNSCGNCFALSVIETIESMMAIKTGNLPTLSVQQMLDCNDYHMSCNGGDSCGLLNWLQTTQTKLQSHDDYASLSAINDSAKCVQETPYGIKVNDYSCNE